MTGVKAKDVFTEAKALHVRDAKFDEWLVDLRKGNGTDSKDFNTELVTAPDKETAKKEAIARTQFDKGSTGWVVTMARKN